MGRDKTKKAKKNRAKHRPSRQQQPVTASKGHRDETGSKRANLSLCMIVKNEEKYLPGCLESLRDLVDEIIVVDTGSTDRTKEIAESFGAKVYHFAWRNDFAAARNESLRHATGDWILYLDADERLDERNRQKIRNLIDSPGKYGAYSVQIVSCIGQGETPSIMTHTYTRLFRNLPGIGFQEPIHEQIVPSLQQAGVRVGFSDVVVQHLGYELPQEERLVKAKRNLEILQQQVQQWPDDSFVHLNLGKTYMELEQHDEALAELRRSLELPSRGSHLRAHAHFGIATILLQEKNDPDAAIAECRKALEYEPDLIGARLILGKAYFAKEEYELAAAAMEQALALSAQVSPGKERNDQTFAADALYSALALSQSRAGLYSAAAANFEKALSLNPNRHEGYFELGRALCEIGDLSRADEALTKYVSVSDSNERRALALLNLGIIDIKLGRLQEAEQHLEEALDHDSNLLVATKALATLWLRQGKADRAKDLLASLPEDTANQVDVLHLQARVCAETGDWEGLADVCLRLLDAGEESAKIQLDLGQALERLGYSDQALKCYERAVELDATYAPAWQAIGSYCARIGNLDIARRSLLLALRLGPPSTEALNTLGLVYVQLGDRAEAERCFSRALRIDPRDETARLNLRDLMATA